MFCKVSSSVQEAIDKWNGKKVQETRRHTYTQDSRVQDSNNDRTRVDAFVFLFFYTVRVVNKEEEEEEENLTKLPRYGIVRSDRQQGGGWRGRKREDERLV